MNIVFSTYSFAFATPGGGEIQLLQYFRNLALKGVSVSKFDLWKGFDQFCEESVMHFFSCMPGSVHFLHACTQRNIPVVVSPNLWVTEETAHQYPFEEIRATLNVADAVVCNSDAECDLLARVFGLARGKFFTVYNAVDEVFLEQVSPDIFRDAFDVRGKFVLNVANIEKRKNQLALVQAMKQFPDMTLVVAGHVRDQAYAEQCAALGGAQWQHIGSLPHASELLRSAYAACEVFALPSTLETPGLAALEAVACGCRLVVTKEGSTTEYFRDEAVYTDPNDVGSIASAIQQAIASPRGALCSRMEGQYLWPLVTEQLIPVYEALLARKRAVAGFFSAQGVQSEGFNAVACDAEGAFVWSRASSSMQAPGGLLVWRWWSLEEVEVDLLVDGALVRQGVRVGPNWAWLCLDLPVDPKGGMQTLELRVRGDAFKVDGRAPGVMLRDLLHLGATGHLDARRENWCLAHGFFFEAAGVESSGFHACERDVEGAFVWSRASSFMQVPGGLVAWRWGALEEVEVDLLVDGVFVRQGVRVGPNWTCLFLDLPEAPTGARHSLEIRLRGDTFNVDGRELGVMLRDLMHLGEACQADARREKWCLERGLVLEAAGVQGEGFYPAEHDERGFFVWSRSEFQLRLATGRVRIDGFVAQKCRVSLVAGNDDVLFVADLEVGEARMVFDLPSCADGQELIVNGGIEKLGAPGHADPRDLGFAIRAIKIQKSINNEAGKK